MISSRVRMSALVSWWSQRLLHKHNIHSLIPGRRTCLSLLTTKHNNQSSGDKSTDWCCLDLARDLPWFCPFPGLPLLSVSPPPHATSTSSGRVSGRRPQALWRGEPQVHLSLPFMCSTEALSLFVDHSVVAAAWQKDWRATGGGGDPRGLAATLLPILPTERLRGELREDVWCHSRKIQNIRLSESALHLSSDCSVGLSFI